MHRKTFGEQIFDVINVFILSALMLLTLYPVWHVLAASFSKPGMVEAHTGLLFMPLGFSLDAYKAVFENPRIFIGYRNTIYYVVVGTAVNIVMTSLGAYVLSRRKLFIKNFLMKMIIVTMYFNGGLIPTYIMLRTIGLYNNIWVMVLPVAISSWNLIIMRTSFMSLPYEMEESAKIDGANDLTVLFRIILPLSMPVIAVMILYYGVGHWNAWFNAMIYLRDRNLHPLQLILKEILIQNDTSSMTTDQAGMNEHVVGESIRHATIIVATVPILLTYPFLQKYFVKGIMIGALKG